MIAASTLCARALVLALSLLVLPAAAHKASDSYLHLREQGPGIALRWDIALRDLDSAIEIDADGDARITWGEVKAAWPAIEGYALQRIAIDGCALRPVQRGLERRSDGAYAVLWLESDCALASAPALRYSLFRETDPTHRGLLKIERAGQSTALVVLDPRAAPGASILAQPSAVQAGVGAESRSSFVGEGVRHIVTGYDHVLFLLCLLLPAAMRRTAQGWQPVAKPAQALLPVAGIVTAFTVAHSITLTLAALGWASLPSWLIEPAIAATIVLAALDNLRPVFMGLPRVAVAFGFGLIHGFGFAGVLAELELPAASFAWALLQFNLGLELGQLGIVLVVTAGFYALRHARGYARWAIQGGSLAAMALGVLWFVERTAELPL